ncbi:glycoside hydrolase family 26 protein [Trujillonella humicola]|uniref:glycoside hydrolase family 26 protein n=1 Tax=Trujillonella humicola TaxID=3383699 RepID=UPI003906A898
MASAGSLPHHSGLSWRSGVYIPGSNAATYASFGQWRGSGLDVVVDWSARNSWNDIVNPTWLYDAWAGTPYTKVFGVAMVPEGDGSATIANCARGAYNDRWREFGRNIVAAGLDDESIIRLGWEFNGNWYKWSAYDPAAWAECWRAIVSSAEQTAPRLRWDWTVNRGVGQSVADARQAYPGDAYVDIIGVDSYDMWPGVRTEADWQAHYAGPGGLRSWVDFARERGKLLSVPEWGVYPGTAHAGNNGGDNAFYIQKMAEFFRSLGPLLAYEAYFNEPASYYAGSIFGPEQNPRAAAAYRQHFRA